MAGTRTGWRLVLVTDHGLPRALQPPERGGGEGVSSFWERIRRKPSVEEALRAGGVPQEEIEHAVAVGGLELLAIDRLLASKAMPPS